MRFYAITIDGAPSEIFPMRYDGPGGAAQWGTIKNGVHDPNAQQIEFQITEYDATTPVTGSTLTIYGVSWDQIKASNQLVGKPIIIYGGMSSGLPLANFQSQRDKFLLMGTVYQCWGNWIGNETSIGIAFLPAGVSQDSGGGDGGGGGGGGGGNGGGGGAGAQAARVNRTGFRSIDRRPSRIGRGATQFDVNPLSAVQQIGGQIISEFNLGAATSQFGDMASSFLGGGNISPLSAPLNLIHNMLPNMPLSDAIQQTISNAFPQANVNVLVSNLLKLGYQDAGMYQSLEQYAGYINNLSQSILGTMGGKYPGIHMTSHSATVDVWDGSQPVGTGDISYLELIGQPTWININTISVKVVLRGGLHMGWYFQLPDTLVGFNGADAMYPMGAPDQRTHITLPGIYLITKVMHIGDFRNPDGASWSTNYEGITKGSSSGAAVLIQGSPEAAALAQGIAPI